MIHFINRSKLFFQTFPHDIHTVRNTSALSSRHLSMFYCDVSYGDASTCSVMRRRVLYTIRSVARI